MVVLSISPTTRPIAGKNYGRLLTLVNIIFRAAQKNYDSN